MKYKNPNAVRGMMAALCMLGILFLSRSAVLAVNAEGDAKIRASAVVEESTGTATVTVALEGNPGIWGLKFKVGYDHSALTLKSVEKGDVFAESDVVLPDSLDREEFVFVAASNRLEDITADGNLATLNFLVKDGASVKSYPITLELIQAINAEGEDADITATVGEDVIEIRGLKESYDYTGAKITPDFDVVDKNIIVDGEPKVLVLGVDYTVKYTNNIKETNGNKMATVIVVGKGNYTGKDVTASFRIEAVKDVSDAPDENIVLINLKGAKIDKINPIPYTGEKRYPDFTLTLNDRSKTEYEYDYDEKIYKTKDDTHTPIAANVALSNNTNKGTATILLTGAAGTNGKVTSVKKTFKINPVDLSKAGDKLTVTVAGVAADAANAPYAVKGATPAIRVSYKFSDDKDAAVLVNGKDYTLKYSSNKKAGPGKFTITGKGNYTKKYAGTNTFTIEPLDMAETELVAVTAYNGLKAGKVKATVVDKNGDMLKASQYIVKVFEKADDTEPMAKNKTLEAGSTIYVRATAKDTKNLKDGTTTEAVPFTVGENIAKAKITLNFKSKIYTGAEITLKESDFKSATIKIKGKNRNLKLKPKNAASDAGYDFEIVSYSNNINKGTATAVIRGIGDYSGTKTIKFKITAKKMTPSIKKLLTDALQRLW